ncbi:hypothetical protein LJC19_06625 [Oxalobacter sp. OttesenSCG-928-P03]|nr:hypothetical protein [Oxalobacter sp. OttesenSCG-928-P03]
MSSFRARVARFWQWFADNEKLLSPWFENAREGDPMPTRQLLTAALNLVIEDLPFEFGGKFEINFSANGRREAAFLTYYLARNLPEALASRWTVTPLKPFVGKEFVIRMFENNIGFGDILIDAKPVGSDRFFLRFYNATLEEMEEPAAYHFFFILLDAALGEGVSISHIDGVEKAAEPEAGMIPLIELRETIAAELAKEERVLNENPCEYYVGYSGTLNDEDDPASLPLRHDIITGFTCQNRLMDEYYGGQQNSFDLYANAGAKAAFIWYFHDHEDLREALDERNGLTDRIIREILGEPDTGKELGINTGQATSPVRCYIDLLLYDEEAFLAKVGTVLKDYGYTFYYTDYLADAESRELPKGWPQ